MTDARPTPDLLDPQDVFPVAPPEPSRRPRRGQQPGPDAAYLSPDFPQPLAFPSPLTAAPALTVMTSPVAQSGVQPMVQPSLGYPASAEPDPQVWWDQDGVAPSASSDGQAIRPAGYEAGYELDEESEDDGGHSQRNRPGATKPVLTALIPERVMDRRGLLLAGLTGITATAAAGTMLFKGGDDAAASAARRHLATPGSATGSSSTGGVSSGSGQALTGSSTSHSPATAAKKPGLVLSRKLDPDLLISRITYGRTAALEHQVHKDTPAKWLAAQLKPGTVADPGGAGILARYPRLGWSTAKVRASVKDGDWAVMQDLVAAHLGRACWSSRQLFEVMVDFWSNHLNVTVPSDGVWDSRHRYDADVIRANALGSFEKMLLASAFHPSMLLYLNNAESTKYAPNENYAREVLELHTVGINAGYTETDVQKAALLLTGWTVMEGQASYDGTRHHVGKLKVFGYSTANSTEAGGKTVQQHYLSYLARHPKTAYNLSYKLAQHFVSDTPPKALVKHMAAVYLKGKTAIAPVLRAMFSSAEFAASAGEKVRRPMEVTAASIRVLGIQPGKDSQGLTDLAWTLNGMGHAPLGWPQPNGYGDTAAEWQSPSMALAQFNATTALVHGWWPNKLNNPTAAKLLSSPPRTRDGVIDAVAVKLFGRKPTSKERSAARTLLAGTSLPSSFSKGTYQQQETVALVATLFLQSPAHLTR